MTSSKEGVIIKSINLALAFLLEVIGILILGYWGFSLPTKKIVSVSIGILAPVLMIIIWSIWCAPTSIHRLDGFSLVALKSILFGLVVLCLLYTKHLFIAIVFALLVVLNLGLSAFWGTL